MQEGSFFTELHFKGFFLKHCNKLYACRELQEEKSLIGLAFTGFNRRLAVTWSKT